MNDLCLIAEEIIVRLRKKIRGGEWYLEKRGSRKILAGSRNLESVLDSLKFSFLHGLFLLFLSLETFNQRVSGSDF